MTTQTHKLTYDDYALIPDDGRRHEIIDGEHYVNPAPNTKHQRVLRNLFLAIASFVQSRRLGEVFVAPYDVLLSHIDIVQPDLLYISNARRHLINDKNLGGAPDLAIEVLSGSNRRHDEVLKKKAYEQFGVLEYWIADPEKETVTIYRRTNDRFASVDVGSDITTPLLPGFTLPLADVFAE